MKEIQSAIRRPLEESVPLGVLKAEIEGWAQRIGVKPREIRVQPMRRKWASCSGRGRLTFNTGLLKQPARFRARVIVHELLHLKVPNHGKLFKALFGALLPQEDQGKPIQARRD